MNDTTDKPHREQRGVLVKWNDEKGYGFIAPEEGGADLFTHVSAFVTGQRRPEQGDTVFFTADRSERRPKAVGVRLKALPLPSTTRLAYGVGTFCLAIYFLFAFGLIDLAAPVAAYLVMSIITFGFYLADKRRAEQAQWRLTETSLHVLEALGGWPGALVAQAALRHKTRKPQFQVVLWSIVAIHVAAWTVWYLAVALSS